MAANPIVDNLTLRAMPDAPLRPQKIGGKELLMDSKVKATTGAGGARMKPVPTKGLTDAGKPAKDQSNPVADDNAPATSVRLRLRVVRGQVSVVGVRAVPGTIPIPEQLDYGLAYEITNGDRRIAVGSIPDIGTQRSFPDPQGQRGMEGHHLAELESFEVNVRMSQKEFSEKALPKLRVTLFRMKGQPPTTTITDAPLAEQFAGQLRPVAELRGIDPARLPTALRTQVRAAATAKAKE